jgi:hypothetical protein
VFSSQSWNRRASPYITGWLLTTTCGLPADRMEDGTKAVTNAMVIVVSFVRTSQHGGIWPAVGRKLRRADVAIFSQPQRYALRCYGQSNGARDRGRLGNAYGLPFREIEAHGWPETQKALGLGPRRTSHGRLRFRVFVEKRWPTPLHADSHRRRGALAWK